jgi:4-hydroxybenzoyl-CoA thioesterase
MSTYVCHKPVRFAHCDPAGIIFYPQYLMIAHEVKEDWLREGLEYPLEACITRDRKGLPVRRLEVDFNAPSRFGDMLRWEVSIDHIGRTSVDCRYRAFCDVELRADIRSVDVRTDLDTGRSMEWEPWLRERLTRFLVRPITEPLVSPEKP